jgi:hypothetical protein
MVNTFRNDIYRSAKTLSLISIGLFSLLAVCGVLYVVFSFVLLLFPDWQFGFEEGETFHVGLIFIGLVGILEIPLQLAAIVFFLIWEYRAFNNISALKARYLELSPGWAVGLVVHPVRPSGQTVSGHARALERKRPGFRRGNWLPRIGFEDSTDARFLVGIFLVSVFLHRIASRMIDDNGNAMEAFPLFFAREYFSNRRGVCDNHNYQGHHTETGSAFSENRRFQPIRTTDAAGF